MNNISREDFVLWNTKYDRPIEGLDIVYHYTSIVELFNDGLTLLNNEEFRCVAELPLGWQKRFNECIELTK
jgi:hypothetical protein